MIRVIHRHSVTVGPCPTQEVNRTRDKTSSASPTSAGTGEFAIVTSAAGAGPLRSGGLATPVVAYYRKFGEVLSQFREAFAVASPNLAPLGKTPMLISKPLGIALDVKVVRTVPSACRRDDTT